MSGARGERGLAGSVAGGGGGAAGFVDSQPVVLCQVTLPRESLYIFGIF